MNRFSEFPDLLKTFPCKLLLSKSGAEEGPKELLCVTLSVLMRPRRWNESRVGYDLQADELSASYLFEGERREVIGDIRLAISAE